MKPTLRPPYVPQVGRFSAYEVTGPVSNFALCISASLMEDVEALATRDAVSVNQFLVQAVAEKVAASKARSYLAERAARATPGDLGRILAKAGIATSIPGDELPEGWPDSHG